MAEQCLQQIIETHLQNKSLGFKSRKKLNQIKEWSQRWYNLHDDYNEPFRPDQRTF